MKKITVVFLLYNAEKTVKDLVKHIMEQERPGVPNKTDWLHVLFMDDCSRDKTREVLTAELACLGNPAFIEPVFNEKNLGLAATVNKAISMVKTECVLTCHCDAFFEGPNYVASMADLMEQNLDAAAITGTPKYPDSTKIPFVEKLNLVSNLMDIFPVSTDKSLVEVGFAEGRCDVFRIEVIKKIGFYDTSYRTAGEDQVLAAKIRDAGFKVYQSPKLRYTLSVSEEQNSLWKLMKHVYLFGLMHPQILLGHEGTAKGVWGNEAGANRQKRALLRLFQMVSPLFYLFLLAGLMGWASKSTFVLALIVVILPKFYLYKEHLKEIAFEPVDLAQFWLAQPLLDVSYAVGLYVGMYRYLKSRTPAFG